MCNIIKSLISITIVVLLFISIFHILSLTKVDLFQQPFSVGEKGSLFYETDNNPFLKSKDLGIKCNMYTKTIMDPNVTKLGDVFDLDIKLLHEKVGTLLILVILAFVMFVFYIVCMIIAAKNKSLSGICLSCLLIITSIAFCIAYFVFLFKTIVVFYQSDINQFLKFLKCKNVNRDGFMKYLFVEDLYYYFKLFVFLSIIHILWNLSSSQPEKNNNQSNSTNNQDIELTENL